MKQQETILAPTSNDTNSGVVWSKEIIKNHENKKLPKIIDLFSGCGGLSLGFRLSGFPILAGFDNWKCAIDTYNANLDHPAYMQDLSDVESTIKTLEPFFEGGTSAIIGGPPCQDFSSAGKRKEGDRADLTEKYAQVVSHFMPPFFVMENVARAERADAFHEALNIFEQAGYTVDHVVLNASYVGVPQRRKRLITFGSVTPSFVTQLRKNLEANLDSKETTVRDWFGERLNTDFYYRHPRSYARRAIFSVDEPSPTIRGVNRPIPVGYPGHPGDAAGVEKARPLTTEERAEIQTFLQDFDLWALKQLPNR